MQSAGGEKFKEFSGKQRGFSVWLPKTSLNSKFSWAFIPGRIQVKPKGNSVQPFVLPGLVFPRKSRRGMFQWEYWVPFRVGIVLWNHAGTAGSDHSWRECWDLGLWEHIPIPAFCWGCSRQALLGVSLHPFHPEPRSCGDPTVEDMESAFPNPGSSSGFHGIPWNSAARIP